GAAGMAVGILGVKLVWDVAAPDQPAQLGLLEDDAARLARVFLDRLPADRLELLPGDDRACSARQRGDDRDLVAVLELRGESLERFDRLVVHVDAHVVMYLAALVAHEPLQAAVRRLELVDEPPDAV